MYILSFKCVNNLAPVLVTSLLVPVFNEAVTELENFNFDIRYFSPKTKYGQRAFSFFAPRLWNSLPLSIKESSTFNTFKSKLKTYLFTSTPELLNIFNRYANLF